MDDRHSFTLTPADSDQWLITVRVKEEDHLAGRLNRRDNAWFIYHVSDALYGRAENDEMMDALLRFVEEFAGDTEMTLMHMESAKWMRGHPR